MFPELIALLAHPEHHRAVWRDGVLTIEQLPPEPRCSGALPAPHDRAAAPHAEWQGAHPSDRPPRARLTAAAS